MTIVESALLLRMVSWVLVLPLLKRVLPLERLVHLMWAPPKPRGRPPIPVSRVVRLAHVLQRARPRARSRTCLERSLLAYRYLAREGANPQLVVGVRRDSREIAGHVWVVVEGRPVREAADVLVKFVPVVAFGARGQRMEAHPD